MSEELIDVNIENIEITKKLILVMKKLLGEVKEINMILVQQIIKNIF